EIRRTAPVLRTGQALSREVRHCPPCRDRRYAERSVQLHIGIAHPEGQRERPVEAPATIAIATSVTETRPAATGATSGPRKSRGKDEEKGLVHDQSARYLR